MRVNIPVLHSLNDVDRTVVVVNHAVKEGSLGPIIVASIGHHSARKVGGWSVDVPFEVTFAQGVCIFPISIDAEGTVNTVVHDHAPCFHAAVSPHQFVHANQT